MSSADTFLDVVFENFKTKIAPFKFCRTAANLVDRQQCKVDGGFLKRCLASKGSVTVVVLCNKMGWPCPTSGNAQYCLYNNTVKE